MTTNRIHEYMNTRIHEYMNTRNAELSTFDLPTTTEM